MRMRPAVAALLVVLIALPVLAAAQFRRQSRQGTVTVDYNSHFAFTRIRYNASGRGLAAGRFRGGGDGWSHDYPTADKNFSAIVDYISHVRVRLEVALNVGESEGRVEMTQPPQPPPEEPTRPGPGAQELAQALNVFWDKRKREAGKMQRVSPLRPQKQMRVQRESSAGRRDSARPADSQARYMRDASTRPT